MKWEDTGAKFKRLVLNTTSTSDDRYNHTTFQFTRNWLTFMFRDSKWTELGVASQIARIELCLQLPIVIMSLQYFLSWGDITCIKATSGENLPRGMELNNRHDPFAVAIPGYRIIVGVIVHGQNFKGK